MAFYGSILGKGLLTVSVKSSSDTKSDAKADTKAKSKNSAKSEGKTKSSEKEKSAAVKPTTLSGAGSDAAVNPAVGGPAPAPSTMLPAAAVEPDPDEVILTDAEGRRYCRSTDCDQIGLVDGYCRYHYLYFWKKIQVRKKILADGKLERYIEELTARYTDKFIELLRKDLRTEKDFLAAVQELELDDSSSSGGDEDEAKNYIEEISGVQAETSRDDDSY